MTHLPPVSLVEVLIVSTLFFIFISGRYVPVMSIITSSVKRQNRGAFMVINSSLQQMSMGAGSLLAGTIIQYNLDGKIVNFNVVGYLSMLLTLIFLYLSLRVKIIES